MKGGRAKLLTMGGERVKIWKKNVLCFTKLFSDIK